MRKAWSAFALATVLAAGADREARADVDVERVGHENPVMEVAKSTIYGGLAGLVVGGAITWAVEENDDDIIRYSFVAGVLVGLGAGIYFVAHRPPPTAMLDFQEDGVALHPPIPELRPDGGFQVRVASVSF